MIFLDLDGTLTDPSEGITRCVVHALEKVGLPTPDPASLTWMIGPPLLDGFTQLGVPDPAQAVLYYRERFSTVGLFENSLYPGVKEALSALQGAGHQMCLATSKPEVFARRITAHFGLDQFLTQECGATLDGKRGSKTDVLRHALTITGADPAQSVMVGDRHHDFDAARALGLPSVGVGWGFGPDEELAKANYRCNTMDDLPGIVVRALPRA